jgi:serine/threonine-protein kinase HipA
MSDFEVHIVLNGRTRQVGLARGNRVRGKETILFEYDDAWLKDPERFSLEPALTMTRGAFAPPSGLTVFGSLGDSAPDTSVHCGSVVSARNPLRRPIELVFLH